MSAEVLLNAEMKTLLLGALSQTSGALVARQDRQPLQTFWDSRVAVSEKQLCNRVTRAARAEICVVSKRQEMREDASGGARRRALRCALPRPCPGCRPRALPTGHPYGHPKNIFGGPLTIRASCR